MTLTKTFLASAALTLLAGVNSHLVVTHPIPFDQASLNNSPLAADGSDFPCKFGGGYTDTVTQMNNVAVGETNNLTFMGSAVHGGGSCQISVTLDKNPTKQSQWKVIHSIIGGCPADVPGNLDGGEGNANEVGNGLKSFSWSLPKGMPSGQYTMAWSWLNRIGNREFYMNCWPVQVTGGGNDNSVYDKLPDMFVANLPPQQCATPETFNFVYPDPGDSVETAATTITTFASTFVAGSSAGCASVTAMGAGAGKAGSPAEATGASGSGSSPSSAAAGGGMIGSSATAAAPSASNTGGVFAPGASSAAPTTMATSAAPAPSASSAAASSAAATPAAPSAAPSAAPGAAPSAPAAAPPASNSSGSAQEVSCTAPGFYCIDDSTFGMCANGKALPQAMAAGTKCVDSKVAFAQKQVPAGTKRSMSRYARHFPAHAHMHRRHALGYDF